MCPDRSAQEMQAKASGTLPGDESLGQQMHELACRLFPIHRSMTGEGNRETLQVLREFMPVVIHEIPTGTTVFDWTVPKEWFIRDAFIANETGERIVDYRRSNLHVVNGSNPVQTQMRWEELKTRIHTLPDNPDWIPYRTDFFTDGWGFCMSHREYGELDRKAVHQTFNVVIDSEYQHGSLTYGEVVLPGSVEREVLIYAHLCHPSLANDNLSGIVVATQLTRMLESVARYHTFRIVFAPATLGAIAWLAQNEEQLSRVDHGLILSLLGDAAPFTYKKSRRGDAAVDRAAEYLHLENEIHEIQDFEPFGYDERQFCSPGLNLPVGRMMRSSHGAFPEYHTSADDLMFIRPVALEESLRVCRRMIRIIERNRTYLCRSPKGEPRLDRSGIYRAFGQADDRGRLQEAILWILNLADGTNDLLSIWQRSNVPFDLLDRGAALLLEHGLVYESASSSLARRST